MPRNSFIQAVSALDARSDSNIQSYFVETHSISLVKELESQSVAIIGLKGTGKTTLYRALVEGWLSEKNLITVGLSTITSSFDSYFDRVNCLQFEASVRSGMLLYILKQLDANFDKFKLDESLEDWAGRKNQILKPTTQVAKLLARFQGLSILGCGLTIRPGEKVEAFEPIPSKEQVKLWDLLDRFKSAGVKLRIVVDDPDRLFTRGHAFDPHLLAGYILGCDYIAQRLGFVQFIHILKSSVYDSLREIEEMANLPYDYFHYIGWNESELKSIITSRLTFSETASNLVFEDIHSYSVPDLVERIRNGPRDLLRYIEIILKRDSNSTVSKAEIVNNALAFKREARRQMESVYSNVYEGIEIFMDAMFQNSSALSISEFDANFQRLRLGSQPTGLDYGAPWLKRSERALGALIDSGSLDVNLDGTWVRPFEAGYFRFDTKDRAAMVRKNAVFS